MSVFLKTQLNTFIGPYFTGPTFLPVPILFQTTAFHIGDFNEKKHYVWTSFSYERIPQFFNYFITKIHIITISKREMLKRLCLKSSL